MDDWSQPALIASALAVLSAIAVALWAAWTTHRWRGWALLAAGVVLAVGVGTANAGLFPGQGAAWPAAAGMSLASLLAPLLLALGFLDLARWLRQASVAPVVQARRVQEMEILNATAIALQRAVTEGEIFTTVGAECARLGFWTFILSFSEDLLHATLRHVASSEPGGLERIQSRAGLRSLELSFPLARLPEAFREAQAGQAAYLDRLFGEGVPDHPFLGLLAHTGQRRALLAPLTLGSGRVVGALLLLSDRAAPEDLPGAVLLARQVSAALETVHWRSEERLRRTAVLRRLAETSGRIAVGLHADQVLDLLCRTLVDQVGYRMAWVVVKEKGASGARLAAHAGCGPAGPPLALIRLDEDEAITGPSGAALLTQRTSVWHDRRSLPVTSPWQTALRELGCYSLVALPLGRSGATWGVLNIASTEPQAFGEDTVPILEMLANQAAAAVEHSWSYTALMAERRRLGLLYEVAREVSSSLEVPEILSRTVAWVTAALDAHSASFFLLDPETRRLHLKAASGVQLPAEVVDRHLNLRLGEGLVGWVVEFGKPALVPDISLDPRWLYVEELDRDVRSAICVPLVIEGRTTGALSVTHTAPGYFQEEHLRLLEAIVQQVAVAMENAALYHRVEAQAEAQARLSSQLRNLQAITQAMSSTLDPQEVLDVVAEGAVTQLGYQLAVVSRYLPEARAFRPAAVYPRGPVWVQALRIVGADPTEMLFPLNLEAKPEQALLLDGRPRISASLADFVSPVIPAEKAARVQRLYRSRAFCAVPIRSKGLLAGSILVGTERPDFSEEDLEALQLAAAQTAVAIENALLYEKEQTGRRVANTLLAASAALGSTLDLDQVLELVLQQLEWVIPYRTALVLLREEGTPTLRVVAARGHTSGAIPTFRLRADRNLIYQEMERSQQPVVIADVAQDPRWEDVPGLPETHAWIGAPLITRGRIIGQLAVFHPTPGFYTAEHSALLLGFASQAAAAIENARLYDQLRMQMEELHRAQARLIQAEKLSAIGQLVSGVAHELNNPLTSVLGYAQMLMRRASLDEDARHHLERIASQATRAARIVRNLLDFAREQPPAKRWIHLNDLLERTLALRAYEMQVSNITVVKDYDPDLPHTMADPQQMQQVFLNIILNAEQALEGQGGGRLVVRTRFREAPSGPGGAGGSILVEFEDDGPGIPATVLPRIFDPFFTTKEVGKGTGLGLSIAYGYVAEHGGQIWAENNPPPRKGCTFYVELPVVPQEPGEEETPEAARREPPPRPARILVVEDEHTVAELYARALGDLGHQVEVATEGQEALQRLRAEPFDLVVSDVKMPGMDGVEFYEALKATHPELAERILFITGDTVSGKTRRFLEESRKPYLSKPVDLDRLEELVNRLLSEAQDAGGPPAGRG
ncbi:MAG: GAF domain-containing protein [Anaerolineae bacterium]